MIYHCVVDGERLPSDLPDDNPVPLDLSVLNLFSSLRELDGYASTRKTLQNVLELNLPHIEKLRVFSSSEYLLLYKSNHTNTV